MADRGRALVAVAALTLATPSGTAHIGSRDGALVIDADSWATLWQLRRLQRWLRGMPRMRHGPAVLCYTVTLRRRIIAHGTLTGTALRWRPALWSYLRHRQLTPVALD